MPSLRTQRQLSGVESDQIALPPASPSDNETATSVSISLDTELCKTSYQRVTIRESSVNNLNNFPCSCVQSSIGEQVLVGLFLDKTG